MHPCSRFIRHVSTAIVGICIVSPAALAQTSSAAGSETIELKTGQRIDGLLKSVGPTSVEVDIAGQVVTLPRTRVRAIYFGSPPSGAVAPSLHGPSGSLRDALRVLKSLQSATSVGISYNDYAPRVTDAKIQIDRLLEDAPKGPARASISEALGFYVYAANAWNAKITQEGYTDLIANPLLEKCAVLKQAVEKLDSESSANNVTPSALPDEVTRGITIAVTGVQPLWECAGERIESAARLIR